MMARLQAADFDNMTDDEWGDFVNSMSFDEFLEMVSMPMETAKG